MLPFTQRRGSRFLLARKSLVATLTEDNVKESEIIREQVTSVFAKKGLEFDLKKDTELISYDSYTKPDPSLFSEEGSHILIKKRPEKIKSKIEPDVSFVEESDIQDKELDIHKIKELEDLKRRKELLSRAHWSVVCAEKNINLTKEEGDMRRKKLLAIFGYQTTADIVVEEMMNKECDAVLYGHGGQICVEESSESDECEELDEDVQEVGVNEGPKGDDWLSLCLLPDPWAEYRHPTLNILWGEEDSEEEDDPGCLTYVKLVSGLGNMAFTPDRKGYAMTKLQLPNKALYQNIETIEILTEYRYLQYVDLSHNNIEDASPVWSILHLMVLDLSFNQISDLDQRSVPSPRPWFLTYLNLSHNYFSVMPDFTHLWALKHINLSFNSICKIHGVTNLKYLKYLNLSHNSLLAVSNLEHTPLQEINLSHNYITDWGQPGPKSLHYLTVLDLSHNRFTSLDIFKGLYYMRKLNLSHNKISSTTDLDILTTLPGLKEFWLKGNGITNTVPDYRRMTVYLAPKLDYLDDEKISSMERLSAVSMYSEEPLQLMLNRLTKRFFLKHIHDPPTLVERIHANIHPGIVCMVGPAGSKKREVLKAVIERNMNIAVEATYYTTLSKPPTEIKYPFISKKEKFISNEEFERMDAAGELLCTDSRLGVRTGAGITELEDENMVVMMFLQLPAALELIWLGYKPTLILAYSEDLEQQKIRIKELYSTTTEYQDTYKERKQNLKIIAERRKEDEKRQSLLEQEESEYNLGEEGEEDIPVLDRSPGAGARREEPQNADICKGCSDILPAEPSHLPKKPEQRLTRSWCDLEYQFNTIEQTLEYTEDKGDFHGSGYSSQVSGLDEAEEEECSEEDVEEEEENEACEEFLQQTLKIREVYMNLHRDRPGLFTQAVCTDNFENAVTKVTRIVKDVHNKLPWLKSKQMADPTKDPLFNDIVEPYLKTYMSELGTLPKTTAIL